MSDYITCHTDSLGVTPCSHVLRDLDAHACTCMHMHRYILTHGVLRVTAC